MAVGLSSGVRRLHHCLLLYVVRSSLFCVEELYPILRDIMGNALKPACGKPLQCWHLPATFWSRCATIAPIYLCYPTQLIPAFADSRCVKPRDHFCSG